MQKSIEVEYWVIDREGALTSPGALADVSEYTEAEFVEPLFELKTPPCETIADLREVFLDHLGQVLSRAEELGKSLVPLGTPINCGRIEGVPDDRVEIQNRVLGADFEYTKYCAGTHLHFEQRNVTDQLNALIALDPALALCNSSPYFQGERVASSARARIYRKRAYERFPDHGQLCEYVDTVGQWERRLDRRYEEFRAAAVAAGVEEDAVAANFTPDDVVWTPVRLRDEMPTVEWRSPDATLPSQVLRLTEEMDAMMERIHNGNVRIEGTRGGATDDGVTLPEFPKVCEYAETAMDEGTESPDVAAYLERMGFDVDGYDPVSAEFDRRGVVSPAEARELRLVYGKRLRRDVAELRENDLAATA